MMVEITKELVTGAALMLVVFGLVIAEGYKSKSINGYEAVFLSGSVSAIVVLGALLMTLGLAHARDPDGRYAKSSLHDWFQLLKSDKGPCCSDADGNVVIDADWESKNGHFRVRIRGDWVDVPDEAVIKTPNLDGRTIVWPVYYNGFGGTKIEIRCFMAGVMS